MITPVRPMPETGRTREPAHRCYIEHGDGTACPNPARYQAHLTWTAGQMHLCEHHAAQERAHGDVIEIRTFLKETQ